MFEVHVVFQLKWKDLGHIRETPMKPDKFHCLWENPLRSILMTCRRDTSSAGQFSLQKRSLLPRAVPFHAFLMLSLVEDQGADGAGVRGASSHAPLPEQSADWAVVLLLPACLPAPPLSVSSSFNYSLYWRNWSVRIARGKEQISKHGLGC